MTTDAAALKLLSPLSIEESKTNPRKHFNEASIAELAKSIAEVGVLQPLLVRPAGDGYELVCGHCRLRAAKSIGLKAVPAIVRELTDEQVLEAMLVENLQRADIHPLEEAEGYRVLMKRHGQKVEAVASRVGKSIKYVYDRVKLLALTKEAQALFFDEKITAGHAVILARLDAKAQTRLLGSGKNPGPLFTNQLILTMPYRDGRPVETVDDEAERRDEVKPISVRELQAWVDDNVRFNHDEKPDPMLFPETVAAMETAETIVPITYDWALSPEKKGSVRTLTIQSWKRADGEKGSKTCEHAITGVVAIGYGRGEAFKVCTAKEKCKAHWGSEMKRRAKRATGSSGNSSRAKEDAARKRQEERLRKEHEQREALQARWLKAKPALLEALAAAVLKAPAKANGYLASVVIERCKRFGTSGLAKLVPLGKTAEDLVRHAAFAALGAIVNDVWSASRGDAKPIFKALNIDVDAILNEHAPVEKSAAKAKEQKSAQVRTCRECGCTDDNCEQCIEATGDPCTWVEKDLCSACAPAKVPKAKKRKAS